MNIFITLLSRLVYELITIMCTSILLMISWNWSITKLDPSLNPMTYIQAICLMIVVYILSGKVKIKIT